MRNHEKCEREGRKRVVDSIGLMKKQEGETVQLPLIASPLLSMICCKCSGDGPLKEVLAKRKLLLGGRSRKADGTE